MPVGNTESPQPLTREEQGPKVEVERVPHLTMDGYTIEAGTVDGVLFIGRTFNREGIERHPIVVNE